MYRFLFIPILAMLASCASGPPVAQIQQVHSTTQTQSAEQATSTSNTSGTATKAYPAGLSEREYQNVLEALNCGWTVGGGGSRPQPIVLPTAPTITTPTGPAPKPIDWGTTIKIPTIPTPTPTPPIVTPPKPTPDDCEPEVTKPVGGGTIVPMMGTIGTANTVDCPPKPKPVPKPDCTTPTPISGGTIVPMAATNTDCKPASTSSVPSAPKTSGDSGVFPFNFGD